jgi:glycosyltransferase involved in cell wall biosynthesis
MPDINPSACLLAPSQEHGGIGRYTRQLADHLESVADYTIVHKCLAEDLTVSEYVAAAVTAGRHDVAHVQFEYGLFRPKLLYAWLFWPVLLVVARLRGTPVVVTVHEVWTPDTVGRFQYAYVYLVHALVAVAATKLVFMSAGAASDFRPAPTDPTRIPHGVDTATTRNITPSEAVTEFGLDANRAVVSQIGYVSTRKGTEEFLALAERHPEHQFLLAGGPLRAEDEPYFERVTSDTPENVTVTGVLSDDAFHAAFAATDVAILAYRDIRQSGILNWCFAYGVPVVCSSIPRFLELSDEGAPLVLFDDDTGGQSLDKALAKALKQGDNCAAAMKSFGERRSMAAVAEEYVTLYDSLRAVDGSPATHSL